MALITNKGKLINDLPLSPTANDNDTLIIQRSDDSGNRTERVTFGVIKNLILNDATTGLENVAGSSNFIAVKNKFTGSFYSPDPSTDPSNPYNSIANFYSLKVRNSLDFTGNLTINNLDCNNILVSSTNTDSLGASNITSVNTTTTNLTAANLTADIINNTFEFYGDTVDVNSIDTNTLVVGNGGINVDGTVITKFVSGSLYGPLLNRGGAIATGSFKGGLNAIGNSVKADYVETTDLTVNNNITINGTAVTATGAAITANQVTAPDGFLGELFGRDYSFPAKVWDRDFNVCLQGDGTFVSTPSKIARFYGTASYALKSVEVTDTTGIFPDQAKTSSYVSYTGLNNGTVYTSINSTTAYQAAILRGMYMFEKSIELSSSLTAPSSWQGNWQQFPSANIEPDGDLTGSYDGISFPDSFIRNLSIKPALTYIRNNYTNYSASYVLIRAELIGKAGNPNVSTPNYVIENPHYAKLQFVSGYTGFDDSLNELSIDPMVKKLIIPFQRNNSIPGCHSESSTFLLKVPTDADQLLYYIPSISSSAGREITSKANAQFSWSYNIYLDGVL